MTPIISIITIALLLIIAFQDMKSRTILWFLPFLVLTCGIYATVTNGMWIYAIVNMIILCIQLILIWFYFSIKEKKITKLIDKKIGLGDILFFIGISPLFSTMNFVLFMIISLFLSVIIMIIANKSGITKNKLIPLAGMQSVCLATLLGVGLFLNDIDLYNDYWLYSIIR